MSLGVWQCEAGLHAIHDVEEDGEHGAGRVHAQGHPPQQLFVQLLLEVLEHEQADG